MGTRLGPRGSDGGEGDGWETSSSAEGTGPGGALGAGTSLAGSLARDQKVILIFFFSVELTKYVYIYIFHSSKQPPSPAALHHPEPGPDPPEPGAAWDIPNPPALHGQVNPSPSAN